MARTTTLPVHYARAAGGHIAYQIVGEGPTDLVFTPGFVSHLELAWEEPMLAGFLRRLASFSRLILYDKRGTGLSDPIADAQTPAERVADITAVMDAAGSMRAAMLGVSEGGPLCAMLAATSPARCTHLVLYSSFARLVNTQGYDSGWSPAWFEQFLADLVRLWGTGVGAEVANPSLAGDDRYREWFARYTRVAASPGMVVALMRMNADIDLRPLLPRIAVPTLVLHRRDEEWMSAKQSRVLAAGIPGARLVELEGRDHWPWIGDAESVVREVERFVTGTTSARRRVAGFALGVEALSRREREVAQLAVEGLTASQIGARLGLSDRTIETYIDSVYRKLEVRSRVELARRAAELESGSI